MGDTSETNTKVLSRELFLSVVALKRLYRKIIICTNGPFSQVRSHIDEACTGGGGDHSTL